MKSLVDYLSGKMPKTTICSSNPVVANALEAKAINEASVKAGKYEWIENEPDTADESSPIGGSWKEFWMHDGVVGGPEVNEWPQTCSVCGCPQDAEHGAHVRDENGKVSIVPMCAKDNNPHNKKEMRLKKNTIMVEVK